MTSGTMTRTFECLSENWKTGVGPDLRKRKVSSIAFFSAPVSKHCMISLFDDDPLEVENPLEVECRY